MAYMSQDRKASLAPAIKAHCRKFGMKASIAVRHHSTLVVNIKSGKLDLCQNYYDTCAPVHAHRYPHHDPMTVPSYMQVNPYWAHEHFSGKCRDFIVGLLDLMNIGNHDRSDIQTDYFDVGWYRDVNVGSWKTPYQVVR
jgi:hypothetical protein